MSFEDERKSLTPENTWTYGLCEWYKNIPICMLTCLCPWATEVMIAHDAGLLLVARCILAIMVIALIICFINVLFQWDIFMDILKIFEEPTMESVNDVNDHGASAVAFISVFLILLLFLSIAHFILITVMRRELRKLFKIKGHVAQDCCIVFCCHDCATCQMYQEVQYQNDHEEVNDYNFMLRD